MTRANTIGARIGGELLAMDIERGRGLLSMDWPKEAVAGARFEAAGTGLTVEPGEAYAVLRGVAVMPVRGMLTPSDGMLSRYLGWATYQGIEAACDELAASEEVMAVVLDMNTPGGLVLGLEAAGEAVARLAAAKQVLALVNPLAASAGYWIASQAGLVTMTPGAEVGSIGTAARVSQPVQPGLMGEQDFIIVSSHARAKRPDPTTEAGRAELQRFADEAEARFHAAIARGRGIDPAELPALLSVTDDPADGGATYGFEAARSRRLVDAQATRADFYKDVFDRYGLQPRAAGSARAGGTRSGMGRAAQVAAAQARAAI